ncbi:uncharacterized protein FOMMEDRAFT_115859 [Fomitiporia mediterranea MF3/22]|uniref:uncharacterized protein n=1 Tax=Fomitiporia mediterranea (strain MF3/22) TaxID=694068 RepID=UPI0004407ED0|nr:uncharacterized protein FOMMEDRAFT_115859 [Fomitiporia mediterranea MF3/22]EJD07551.1 hypothetical protein FOMMEDRAFT_115859 [Fomitiporia mediterranea MF3/22]
MRNVRVMKGDTFIVVTSDDARLFGSNRIASSAHEALQRGKACLGCRRRKMRCDGLRPICTQCSRRNRIDDCEYTDDATGPTRTQILEETLARLQARVKELEKLPAITVSGPAIPLHKPYCAESASAVDDVVMSPSFSDSSEGEVKPTMSDQPYPITEPTSSSSSPQSGGSQPDAEWPWWELDEPPQEIANMLIRLFLPNSHQLGFSLNVKRFLKSLAEPSTHPSYPHPGLMNAIYLWALRLSLEPTLQSHENVYLKRAIGSLQNIVGGGLGDFSDPTFPTRVLHVMQAEVLIAQYFFTHGRHLEGRYHANAAVSLAVSYGFHRMSPSSCGAAQQSLQPGVGSPFGLIAQTLPPVKTCVEYGERVNLFWAVYNIDRCWSVVGNPCIMSDDPAHGTQIDTPWPWDMQDYELADMNSSTPSFAQGNRTIQRFLSGEPPAPGVDDTSFAALRVKVSAIYERVAKLVMAWKASSPNSPTRQSTERDMRAFSDFLFNFIASLPPVENLQDQIMSSDDRRTVYVAHGLAHTSVIVLHEVWTEEGEGNQAESDICLESAWHISRVPRAGVDVGLLDPVLGTTGMTLASLFVREVIRARKAPKTPENIERLKRIEEGKEYLKATAIFGKGRPVYGLQVPKILAILKNG